jgi:hypothetical protein
MTLDPNAALELIRGQMRAFFGHADAPRWDASALADAITGLDDWLSNGGFTPNAWRYAPPIPLPTCEGSNPFQHNDNDGN